MKYGHVDIKDLWNSELLQAYDDLRQSEAKRSEASKHEKFKKTAFAPTNPAFIELKTAIINEIRTRKLMDI